MLDELVVILERRKSVSLLYVLTLSGLDREARSFSLTKQFSLLEGTRNKKNLLSLFHRLFEQESFPGPIYHLHLRAHLQKHFAGEQIKTLRESSREALSHELDGLMNNISSLLGKESIFGLSFRESHIPERSFAFQPKTLHKTKTSLQIEPRSYPSYILSLPEPIQAIALLPDKPPVKITWRKRAYRIVNSFGPEKISSEWWSNPLEQPQEDREYFTLQEENGRWLWVYRCQRSHEWYLQGVWA